MLIHWARRALIHDETPGDRASARSTDGAPERHDRLDLDEGGSWAIPTESGSHYQLLLDGDEKKVIRLAVDHGHSYPDGTHPFRRDGGALLLFGLVDPPIRVGYPAKLVVGVDPDGPDRASTTQMTSPVVEIRRLS